MLLIDAQIGFTFVVGPGGQKDLIGGRRLRGELLGWPPLLVPTAVLISNL